MTSRAWAAVLVATFLTTAAPARSSVAEARLRTAIEHLQSAARAAVADGEAPGIAVAVVHDDVVAFAGGFGVRRAGAAEPVDASTVFQLASLSKPLASTVVAALVGEGKVAWSAPISDVDPAFQLRDPWVTREVTIADLMSHRSGLPDHAGDLLEDLGYDRGEVLRRLRLQVGGGAFRASYAYTNFGFTEGALAAAKPYHTAFEDAAVSRLFAPLGMTTASYRFGDFMARADRAWPHVRVDGRWESRFQRRPDAQSPAGGASASVRDLAQWMRLQLADGVFAGRRLIAAGALAETHAPQIRTGINHLTGGPAFYGLGWNVGYDAAGRLTLTHSGAFALGASTAVYLVPSEHLGVVALVNAAPEGLPKSLTYAFVDEALNGRQSRGWRALFHKVFSDPAAVGVVVGQDWAKRPPSSTAPGPMGAYVGRYHNDYFGEAWVSEQGGGLVLALGPGPERFALTPFDRDSFTFETRGENAVGRTGVTFTLGADGAARRLTIDYLDQDGDGVFVREIRGR